MGLRRASKVRRARQDSNLGAQLRGTAVQLHNLQQPRVCVASCLGRCWCPWSCSRSGLFPLIGATDPPVVHADLQTARTPRKQHGRAGCEDAGAG